MKILTGDDDSNYMLIILGLFEQRQKSTSFHLFHIMHVKKLLKVNICGKNAHLSETNMFYLVWVVTLQCQPRLFSQKNV